MLLRPPPAWLRELAGAALALAIAIAVMGAVALSPRGALLLDDGDSFVTLLFARSLTSGGPQDWAMSSVLFIPETALVTLVWLCGFGVNGTLLVSGILGFASLYAGLRVAAGERRVDARGAGAASPVAGALAGYAVIAACALLERSASHDALELASLSLTTTYYVATAGALLATVGLTWRALVSPRPRGALVALAAVAAVSVLSNPLFAGWAVVPLVVVVGWVALRHRMPITAWIAVALVGGTGVGLVARIPFAPWIANTGVGYADPADWWASLGYYAGLVGDRARDPLGALSIAIVVLALAVSAVATGSLARRGDLSGTLLAACGWVVPVIVVVGAVALGTHAARYLQPVVIAAPLGLVALVGRMRPQHSTRRTWALTAGALAASLVAAPIAATDVVRAASSPDADLACVTNWIDASGRTGGGQFWTVRLPKSHLADPSRLVQLDDSLRGYGWLVNRADFRVGAVSFLLIDAQSPPFALPPDLAVTTVACGRYTIVDFPASPLPIGPTRS